MASRRAFLGRVSAGLVAGFGGKAWGQDGRDAMLEASVPLRRVTEGPKAHFFGYYEKSPWDATGRYMLSHEIGYCDHQPAPGDRVTVGLIDREAGDAFRAVDETAAWSWQQGSMLQWMPTQEDQFIYNSVDDEHYTATVRDVAGRLVRTFPRPIYAVSPKRAMAVSLDFARLDRLRPGYGYNALPEQYAEEHAPEALGVWTLDLESGESERVISLKQLAELEPDDRFEGAEHWVNHLQFAPGGNRYAFLHRWKRPEDRRWGTRLLVASLDDPEPKLVMDTGMVSHYDWRDDRTILAWSRTPEAGDAFYLIDVEEARAEPFARETLPRDGHCSYSPDRRWILNDTYPDENRMQHLMLVDASDGRVVPLGAFYLPPMLTGPVRCDLHPRWNRDGTQVCIDSAHEGGMRQLIVLEVGSITSTR